MNLLRRMSLPVGVIAVLFAAACDRSEVVGPPIERSSGLGVVTGTLHRAGGPSIQVGSGGEVRAGAGGEVTVFTASGRPEQHVWIQDGRSFTFRLPPGRYLLNSGTAVWDRRSGCKAVPVTVKAHRTVRVSVAYGCLFR